jgi:hypothetical protein
LHPRPSEFGEDDTAPLVIPGNHPLLEGLLRLLPALEAVLKAQAK